MKKARNIISHLYLQTGVSPHLESIPAMDPIPALESIPLWNRFHTIPIPVLLLTIPIPVPIPEKNGIITPLTRPAEQMEKMSKQTE